MIFFVDVERNKNQSEDSFEDSQLWGSLLVLVNDGNEPSNIANLPKSQ